MQRKVLTALGVVLVALFIVVPAASARWAIGNGPTDLELNELAPPALPGQVCTTHIDGRAGLSTTTDPAVTPPPPPPDQGLKVELFTGPPGSLAGAHGVPGGLELADGTTTVSPIASVTTAPPAKLNPAEEYMDFTGVSFWEYAAAPFSFNLAADQVTPGNDVALRQGGYSAIITAKATACASTPPPITAVIDVLPGLAQNPVIPSLRLPVLPVRVFGSSTLDVTKIATLKLGNAQPAVIPPSLARFFAPKDRNGDGFLDQDYLFVPAATGIVCGDTSVGLTGTLTGGESFSGTDAIKTVHC